MPNLYAKIDSSSLLMYLFYPRRQHGKPPEGAFDLEVPVEKDISIICRAFRGVEKSPWILYFHGNGEVVSDYNEIAPMYNDKGINLLVADYRGYGASQGNPNFQNMVNDARVIFDYVFENISENGVENEWFVMGRSLGSISALELAVHYPDRLSGLIIESGFISVAGLINHLGLPSPGDLAPLENEYRRLTGRINLPALVIHGQHDHLVPFSQGKDLFESLGSEKKELIVIPGADHNDIMFVDPGKYMNAINSFVSSQGGIV